MHPGGSLGQKHRDLFFFEHTRVSHAASSKADESGLRFRKPAFFVLASVITWDALHEGIKDYQEPSTGLSRESITCVCMRVCVRVYE